MIGSYTRRLVIARYAQTGEWCPTARLVWAESKVPDDIVRDAREERARHEAAVRAGRRDECDCKGCSFKMAEVDDG